MINQMRIRAGSSYGFGTKSRELFRSGIKAAAGNISNDGAADGRCGLAGGSLDLVRIHAG